MAPRSRRDASIDLVRGLAVLAMILTHAGKAFLDDDHHWGLGWFIYVPEPIIPAIFLAVSGYALVLVAQDLGPPSLRRLGRRALELTGLAYVMFLFGYGFRIPDLIFAPGILAMIGIVSLILALCLRAQRPTLIIATLLGACIATFWLFDRQGIRILGFNWGNESLLQNLCYGLVGALVARVHWHRRDPDKLLQPMRGPELAVALLLCGGMTAILLAMPVDPAAPSGRQDVLSDSAFDSLFYGEPGRAWLIRRLEGRHLLQQIGHWVFHQAIPRVRIRYWVARPPLLLFLCSLTGVVMLAKPLLERALASPIAQRATHWVRVIGRHSLVIYVVHLTMIGALTIPLGHRGMDTEGTLAWFAAVTLGMTGLAYLLERRKRMRRAAAVPAVASAPRPAGRKGKRKKR